MENTVGREFQSDNNFSVWLRELFRKKVVISIIIALSLLFSIIYSLFFITPLYTSCAKIYVFNNSSTQISTSDISISSYLAKDYSELIVDRVVLEEVIDELKLNYSYSKLKNYVTVINPESTRILEIYVKTPDPELSQKIADKICVVAQAKIVEFMNIDQVNIFSKAFLPQNASHVNMGQAVIYGLLLGIAISAVILIISIYQNDKICGEEDVEKYLGLCTLGTIPYNPAKSTQRSNSQKSRRIPNGN